MRSGLNMHQRRFRNRGSFFIVIGALLLTLAADRSRAVEFGPSFPLTERDRLLIEKGLGKGVVGEAVAASTIIDPAAYLALAVPKRTYRLITEGRQGNDEIHRAFPVRQGRGRPSWHYELGREEVGFLEASADGDFVLTGIQDLGEGVVTHYSPPEPVLLKGLAPGDERKLRMAVRVYDAAQPQNLSHKGWLDVVYRYVGAYRIKVPAGSYEAVLIKSTFNGKIGPAAVDDSEYRFFARNAGMVALVERRDVSAFLLYHTHMEVAKVLVAVNPH